MAMSAGSRTFYCLNLSQLIGISGDELEITTRLWSRRKRDSIRSFIVTSISKYPKEIAWLSSKKFRFDAVRDRI
jgi:hypothetical protein